MNKYFKDLLRTTSIHAIAIIFLVGTFTVFAVTFPSSTPTGETAGGLFMKYFGKILVDSNITTTDGTVNRALKLKNARTIAGVSFDGTANIAIPWSGITSKPFNRAGQAGQPTRLWGSNDGTNYYVWNPSNFIVNNISTPTVGYKHIGAWGVGRTAVGAVLVNTAYTSDNATNSDTTDGFHLNQNVTTAGSPSFSKVTGSTVCIGSSCRTSWPSTTGDGVGPANRSCYDTTNGNDGMAQCAAGFVVVGVQANGVACGGECVATTVRCCK